MRKEIRTLELLNNECHCSTPERFLEIACLMLMTQHQAPKIKDAYKTMLGIADKYSWHFPGDEKLFCQYYETFGAISLKEITDYVGQLSEHTAHELKLPATLIDFLFSHLSDARKNVLITDCWQYGDSLRKASSMFPSISFTATCPDALQTQFYSYIYNDCRNIRVIQADIYSFGFTQEKFDYILSVPSFAGRVLVENEDFICKETDLVALQNLLYHLSLDGELSIVMPARITFAASTVSTLRSYIEENYQLRKLISMPPALFSPYTGIRTFALTIGNGRTEDVVINRFENLAQLAEQSTANEKLLFREELSAMDGWNVDLVYAEENPEIQRFNNSSVKKIPLTDIATIFRGKAITDKGEEGTIGVINISDISDDGIDYDHASRITEEERKIAKYALQEGDVLITTRGTTLKLAVFTKQAQTFIPSANIAVIRPGRLLCGGYLKLFFESPAGKLMLESLKRGTTIVNLNYNDLGTILVPVPAMDQQLAIVQDYNQAQQHYQQVVRKAENEWQEQVNKIQSQLY